MLSNWNLPESLSPVGLFPGIAASVFSSASSGTGPEALISVHSSGGAEFLPDPDLETLHPSPFFAMSTTSLRISP